MMWNQKIVTGELTRVGEGTWSGDTFKASVIEIGGRSLLGIRAARCLLERMETGKEMERPHLRRAGGWEDLPGRSAQADWLVAADRRGAGLGVPSAGARRVHLCPQGLCDLLVLGFAAGLRGVPAHRTML